MLKSTPTGYKDLKSRKDSGAHYTPQNLADFVAKHILSNYHLPGKKTVLDPAVGDGELLAAIARLDNKIELQGIDIDADAVSEAQNRLESLNSANLQLSNLDFLNDLDYSSQEQLFDNSHASKVDMIIANPPYIRTQVLGSSQAKLLATKYGLTGRVDIYHAFIAKFCEALKPGGIAGIIVSNRFMYTQGGNSIRQLISKEFDILHIWDFGDTKIFEAAVLPAVLILRKKNSDVEQASTTFTSVYSLPTKPEDSTLAKDLYEALDSTANIEINGNYFAVNTGILHIDGSNPWRLSEQSRDDWLEKVESNTHKVFEDISKVKVGIKTTADKVFIKKDWSSDENELLQPLITHHVAERFRTKSPTTSVLYPYSLNDDKKEAVNLDMFPKAKKYLLSHRERLESRTYVIEGGRKWYEIWVPHKPGDWKYPKIVFRDISEKPTFWADFEGSIVNGDCYWMSFKNVNENLIWLVLAVANSTFIEKFYDYKFNNKLYSGRRRFITQYVSKFPIPDPELDLSKSIVELASDIYNNGRSEEKELILDKLVWEVFGAN